MQVRSAVKAKDSDLPDELLELIMVHLRPSLLKLFKETQAALLSGVCVMSCQGVIQA